MAFPPGPVAADKTNDTAVPDDHPAHHNELAAAINDTVSELVEFEAATATAFDDVDTALGGKADLSHDHAIGDTSGLQAALDGKQPLDPDLTALAAAGNSAVLAAATASFTTADETKLDGIESGATADQTAAEILTAIKTVDGPGSGLDADTLDGVDAGSFVRDTGDETIAGVKTFSSDPLVPDEAYDATAWNGSLEPPTKNAVRDKIEAIGTYADYVPTVTQNGARTTSGVVARYTQIGKQVHVIGKATITNAGSSGNALTVSLPVTAAASGVGLYVGDGWIGDLSATDQWNVSCRLATNSTLDFYATSATNQSAWGVNPSLAVANGDVVAWSVTYEAA